MALLLLEHINLSIPDIEIGRKFYVQGLGGKEVPKDANGIINNRLLHVNLGVSQMHLPCKNFKTGEILKPQVIDGFIHLITDEDLNIVKNRLDSLFNFSLKIIILVQKDGDNKLQITCPYGNIFILTKLKAMEGNAIRKLGSHPGGTGKLLGIKKVHFFTQPNSISQIAIFYKQVFGISPKVERNICVIDFPFAGQTLSFEEKESCSLNKYDEDETKKYHIAIYVANQDKFEQAFSRANEINGIFVNPQFEGMPIEFASSTTIQEIRESFQFRLKDIRLIDDDKNTIATLEHEVRSPYHKCFPLLNFTSNI